MLVPILGTAPGPGVQVVGPTLLLAALVAALVGRMRSATSWPWASAPTS